MRESAKKIVIYSAMVMLLLLNSTTMVIGETNTVERNGFNDLRVENDEFLVETLVNSNIQTQMSNYYSSFRTKTSLTPSMSYIVENLNRKNIVIDNTHGNYHIEYSFITTNMTNYGATVNILDSVFSVDNTIDILMAGGPETEYTETEKNDIKSWFDDGSKILWVASDSDYAYTSTATNTLLDYLGAHLRFDWGTIEDHTYNDGAAYRVVATTPGTGELASIVTEGVDAAVFHGPTAILGYNESIIDLRSNSLANVEVIFSTSAEAIAVEFDSSGTQFDYYVDQSSLGTYPMLVVERIGDSYLIVSAESIFADYKNMYGQFTENGLYDDGTHDGAQLVDQLLNHCLGDLLTSYTSHAPIEVSNDAELSDAAVSGSGSKGDPYILEGWKIQTSGIHGIAIYNTTSHFVIRDCWINTGNVVNTYGIHIANVSAGTATVSSTFCLENECGIHIDDSANSTIIDNFCDGNSEWGIHLRRSGNASITKNTCKNNYWGLGFEDSGNSIIAYNTFNLNTEYGIWLIDTDSSTVTDNAVNHNNDDGIVIYSSDNCVVANNSLTQNNNRGISLYNSNNCLIDKNYLFDNQNYGVHVNSESDNNLIYHNYFIFNNQGNTQAYDDGTNNLWYDSSANEGNYWSDYSGSGSYSINGLANAYDLYPSYATIDDHVYHRPIYIHSNSDFVAQGFPGSGTVDDPYLIEWLYIIGLSGDNNLIYIEGTTAYFCIKNNLIDGSSVTFSGISLNNAIHGTIINNTVYNNNGDGIRLEPSANNNLIVNNTAYNNNWKGIRLHTASNNIVVNNTVYNNGEDGIWIGNTSNNNTIIGNIVRDNPNGIVITLDDPTYPASEYNIIDSNIVFNNRWPGIRLSKSKNATVSNNIVRDNGENGISLNDQSVNNLISNNIVNNNGGNGIALGDQSVNNLIYNNRIYTNNVAGIMTTAIGYNVISTNLIYDINMWAIYIGESNDITISNNIIRDNNQNIVLYKNTNCYITNNTVKNSYEIGILFEDTDNCLITWNQVTGSRGCGIQLGTWDGSKSTGNIVHHNSLIDNGDASQGYDDGTNNVWYDTSTNEGNYWSDYSWPHTYYIDGSAGSTDPYPLNIIYDSFAPVVNQPDDMTFEQGITGKSINWAVSDEIAPDTYVIYQNGSEILSGSWKYNSTISLSLDGFEDGVYNFTLIVFDYALNNATDTVLVFISKPLDTLAPTINHPDDITYELGTVGHSISWLATDETAPGTYILYQDGTQVASGSWENNVAIIINIDGLEVGSYSYTLDVFDAAGNEATDIVVVDVTGVTGDTNGSKKSSVLGLSSFIFCLVIIASFSSLRKRSKSKKCF